MDGSRLSLLQHQLSQAYDIRSWHGPNLLGSLRSLEPEVAAFRPQPERHNIWEIALHCAYWKYRVCRLISADAPRSFSLRGSDWFPRPMEHTSTALGSDLTILSEWHNQLLAAVGQLKNTDLDQRVGNGQFTVAEIISGAAAHDLYHAGQIRLLRRMASEIAT